MRDLRAALARGEPVAECSKCWEEERGGAVSLRRIFNGMYRATGRSLDRLVQGVDAPNWEAGSPELFFLNVGNLCNLQCRSCSPHCSSRIATDRVHTAWGEGRLRPAWRGDRLRLAPLMLEGAGYCGFDAPSGREGHALQMRGEAVIELVAGNSLLRSLSLRAESTSAWRLRVTADGRSLQESLLEPGASALKIALNVEGVDQLHISFEAEGLELEHLELERARARPAFKLAPDSKTWFADASRLADMVDGNPNGVTVHLLGGEPMMNNESWALLDELVTRGAAERVALVISTNGTHRRDDLARLAPAFRSVYVSLSVDGYGPMFEYLRHGAHWDELMRTVDWLRALPNIDVAMSTVMQNYNAFDCLRLFRFCDSIDLPFLCHNVLMTPARLHLTNLPPRVRRIAAARLREYAQNDCRDRHREMVNSLVDILESAGDVFDPVLFREFMLFTNDLDSTRSQRMADAAPDLAGLIAASGVDWTEDLHHSDKPLPKVRNASSFERFLPIINKNVSEKDVIFQGYETSFAGYYYISALRQLDIIDELMRRYAHAGLSSCAAMADYASHYGRITRAMRVAAPEATVYACDIDPEAIHFCARELGAHPLATSWRPDEDPSPENLDLVVCSSLLTHTGIEHWRRALRAWMRMVKPGGFVFFTFLSEDYISDWRAGRMEHYGRYTDQQRDDAERQLHDTGLGFAGLEGVFSDENQYGIALATAATVRAEAQAAGFEVLELVPASSTMFGQELAVLRRPARAQRATTRNARVLAFYQTQDQPWTALCSEGRSLPTDLGFCDGRVAEVREAQAELAREHGIDGFSLTYSWSAAIPGGDPALRNFLFSGRPDFPFCITLLNGDAQPIASEAAEQIFSNLLRYLRDDRYVLLHGAPLLIVRDVSQLASPQATTKQWRAAAIQNGLAGLHLCAG